MIARAAVGLYRRRTAALQVGGFGLISLGLGLWLVPVGVFAAGVSLVVLAGLSD